MNSHTTAIYTLTPHLTPINTPSAFTRAQGHSIIASGASEKPTCLGDRNGSEVAERKDQLLEAVTISSSTPPQPRGQRERRCREVKPLPMLGPRITAKDRTHSNTTPELPRAGSCGYLPEPPITVYSCWVRVSPQAGNPHQPRANAIHLHIARPPKSPLPPFLPPSFLPPSFLPPTVHWLLSSQPFLPASEGH